MEKGSFHTSVSSVLQTDEAVKNLALPDELPKPLDLKKVPIEALRSSAIDTLLSQNEDLMARLSVALRRSNFLEDKMGEVEKQNHTIRHRYEALKDQIVIMQEKERLMTERSFNIHAETSAYQEKLKGLEQRFVEIYTDAKAQKRRLERFLKYRAKMKKIAKELQSRTRRLATLSKQEEVSNNRLRLQLETTEEQLNRLQKESSGMQMQIINQFEAQIADLQAKSDLLYKKAVDRETLAEDKIKLENQLIYEERQFRIYREETQTQIEELQEQNQSLRAQVKVQLVEMERAIAEQKVASVRVNELESEKKAYIDQVESLQILWRNQQQEIERWEEKYNALQKLNQQLSVSLNQSRRDLTESQREMEAAKFSSDEQIKALKLHLDKGS